MGINQVNCRFIYLIRYFNFCLYFSFSVRQEGDVVTVNSPFGVKLTCDLSGAVICYVTLSTHRNGTVGTYQKRTYI